MFFGVAVVFLYLAAEDVTMGRSHYLDFNLMLLFQLLLFSIPIQQLRFTLRQLLFRNIPKGADTILQEKRKGKSSLSIISS